MEELRDYDVVIVGGGPGGTACALTTRQAGIRTCLIDPAGIGGRLLKLGRVAGSSSTGIEMATALMGQAFEAGVDLHYDDAISVERNEDSIIVSCESGRFVARAMVLATGQKDGALGLPNERELHGHGLSYCPGCDGPLFSGRSVAVIGGSDWAASAAVDLAQFAERVVVVHDGTALYNREFGRNQKLSELPHAAVTALNTTDERLTSLTIISDSGESELDVGGVFPLFGWTPDARLLPLGGECGSTGAVIVNDAFETTVSGVFAVGDVTHTGECTVDRALTDGAAAGSAVTRFLSR